MERFWLLVADSSRARLFSLNRFGKQLREERDFTHSEGRLKPRDLIEDKSGRSFDSAGSGRHALGKEVEPKAQESERFARELGEAIEQLRVDGRLHHLYIVAPPAFLGVLRKSLPSSCTGSISNTLSKNLVREDIPTIESQVTALFRS
jgi:protein required for attachment to host cells